MKVFMGKAADKDRQVFEDAGKCTNEATMNIRTVASLGLEDHFVEKYRKGFRFKPFEILHLNLKRTFFVKAPKRKPTSITGQKCQEKGLVIWFSLWLVDWSNFLYVCWVLLLCSFPD